MVYRADCVQMMSQQGYLSSVSRLITEEHTRLPYIFAGYPMTVAVRNPISVHGAFRGNCTRTDIPPQRPRDSTCTPRNNVFTISWGSSERHSLPGKQNRNSNFQSTFGALA